MNFPGKGAYLGGLNAVFCDGKKMEVFVRFVLNFRTFRFCDSLVSTKRI